MNSTRRNFLIGAGGVLSLHCLEGFLGPFQTLAQAQTLLAARGEKRFFVLIRVHGGMDASVGLDPWVDPQIPSSQKVFLDYDPRNPAHVLRRVGGTDINLGPAALKLEPFVNRMALVKGIWMGPHDVGHPPAMHYISCGKTDNEAPDLAVELAEQQRVKNNKPDYGIVYHGKLQRLDRDVKATPARSILHRKPAPHFNTDLAAESLAHNAFDDGSRASQRSKSRLGFLDQTLQKILKDHPIDPSMGTDEYPEDGLVGAMASGLSWFGQLDWIYNGEIDNHFDYSKTHIKGQGMIWNRVARFLKLLEETKCIGDGSPLSQVTTVMVCTEFTRTPALNRNLGKDHNYPHNVVMLYGNGIKGGTTVGNAKVFPGEAPSDPPQLRGQYVDYRTGGAVELHIDPDDSVKKEDLPEGVDLIRPANIIRTLAELFKVDDRNFKLANSKIEPLKTLID